MYVRHQQGRLGELVPLIEQAVTENPGLPAFRPILARLISKQGTTSPRTGFSTRLRPTIRFAADGFRLDDGGRLLRVRGGRASRNWACESSRPPRPLSRAGPHRTLGFVPVALALGGLTRVLGRYDEAETYLAEAAEIASRGRLKFAAALNPSSSGNDAWWLPLEDRLISSVHAHISNRRRLKPEPCTDTRASSAWPAAAL